MGAGLLAVKSGCILFTQIYQFLLVRVLALDDFGCRWLSQLWRVTAPRPNLCGHDTGGFRVLLGEV